MTVLDGWMEIDTHGVGILRLGMTSNVIPYIGNRG